MFGGGAHEPFQVARLLLNVDRLDHEHWPLTGQEGPLKRLDQTERILTLEGAEEVEGEKKDEAVLRQSDVYTRQVWRWSDLYRHREHTHRFVSRVRNDFGDVVACDPDLVDEVEG